MKTTPFARTRNFRSSIECLEARIAPATFTVTNTSASNVAGSFLFALNLANATPNVGGPDIVAFNLAGAGPFTISPVQPYAMTEAVIIDGFTQPTSSANTLAAGDNAVMQIVINGASAGGGATGLRFTATADGSTVRGLVINGYSSGAALAFDAGSDNNVVEGCFIGTNVTGTAAVANSVGISIAGSNNTIGGLTPAARNLISGNATDGVRITGLAATGNVIAGNFIGLNAAGTADLGAADGSGILISDGPNTTIGGPTVAARNFISGNNVAGINIAGTLDVNNETAAHDYLIQGNYIGTDVTGTIARGNSSGGIRMTNAPFATITGNLVSGNSSHGIDISGVMSGPPNPTPQAHDYTITGNIVGLDATGSAALGNSTAGVRLSMVRFVAIGGTAVAERNIVAANGGTGLDLASVTDAAVLGNYLGTDATGTLDRGNGFAGLDSLNCTRLTLGGTAPGPAI